jgi:hypothetical protein
VKSCGALVPGPLRRHDLSRIVWRGNSYPQSLLLAASRPLFQPEFACLNVRYR